MSQIAEDRMDKDERDRLDRLDRAAEAEKGPGDPQAVTPRSARPLIAWLCIAVVIVGGLFGVLYWRSHDHARSVPPAQQEAQTPGR
jgi:hypothetical protein